MLDLNFPNILELFNEYRDENRSNSAAFLIWYLENYYRLDSIDAIDAVCDKRGDKGIDGIYINHAEGTIDIFQTKLSERIGRTLGDSHLKEFVGSLTQFASLDSLKKLQESSTTHPDLRKLIQRINLEQYIEQYVVNGIFISNMNLDNNGRSYLEHAGNLKVIGPIELERDYILDSHTIDNSREIFFSIGESEYLKYSVNKDVYTIVAPIKARELVNMKGIKNQEVFVYNVRSHLGSTAVNKAIVKTVEDKGLHSMFPLFHNGITIVCDALSIVDEKQIKIKNYFVVNGCQSLSTLYKKSDLLTDDLNILVKFVQVAVDSDMAKTITNFSNNQNGIKPRDFKSNHPIQIRLKNDVENNFPDYFFEIKRGEAYSTDKEIISNEELGMWIMAFDSQEPWDTHRKYQIFDEKYNQLFAKPNVNAARIIFLYKISKIIDEVLKSEDYMKNRLIAKYSLTKYAIFYILRSVLEADNNLGVSVITNPGEFLSEDKIDILLTVLREIIIDITVDFNYEVDGLGDDFDYRTKLRDKSWVQAIRKNIIASNQKEIAKQKVLPFSKRFEEILEDKNKKNVSSNT